MFNTLKYAKIIEEAGFSQGQAETSMKVLVEIMEDKLTTKQDLKDLELVTKHELKELEYRLTIRMGTMLAASIAILTAVIKFV